eukprot:4070583-Heterocapsa_arctica.AAC.1
MSPSRNDDSVFDTTCIGDLPADPQDASPSPHISEGAMPMMDLHPHVQDVQFLMTPMSFLQKDDFSSADEVVEDSLLPGAPGGSTQ